MIANNNVDTNSVDTVSSAASINQKLELFATNNEGLLKGIRKNGSSNQHVCRPKRFREQGCFYFK